MTGHGFLKGLIEHTQKLYLQDNLYPGWLTGSTTKLYHPEFINNNNNNNKSIYIALILCSAKRFTMQKKKRSG